MIFSQRNRVRNNIKNATYNHLKKAGHNYSKKLGKITVSSH